MTDEEKNKEHLKQRYVGYGYPVEERFLPRVWDGKQYYYPKFGELGLTYESGNGEIMTLAEAFGWVIDTERYKDAVCFKYILEACTGLKDKNGRLIYENDLVEYFGAVGVVYWGTNSWLLNPYGKYSVLPTIDHSEVYEVIGNVHERKENEI